VLCELNRHSPKYGSWFVGDAVVSDGSLLLATPIDPLFCLLPGLERNAARNPSFMPLDSLLDEAGEVREALGPLLLALEEQALCLCATKKAGGETYYRFDESRALAWLGCKVRALASSLGGLELYAGFAEQQLTALCINLLEEYVEGHWTRRLRAQFGMEEVEAPSPMPAIVSPGSDGAERPEKRPRIDPKELARAKAKVAREEKKAEEAKKASKGTKSLLSFFGQPKAKG